MENFERWLAWGDNAPERWLEWTKTTDVTDDDAVVFEEELGNSDKYSRRLEIPRNMAQRLLGVDSSRPEEAGKSMQTSNKPPDEANDANKTEEEVGDDGDGAADTKDKMGQRKAKRKGKKKKGGR